MNKKILGIGMFVLMVGLASAFTMYAGESYTYDLTEGKSIDNIYSASWYFNDNVSITELQGVNVSIIGNYATIEINPMFEGEFNVTFILNGAEEVFVPSGSGGSSGGSSSGSNVVVLEDCTNWTECDGYFQFRECDGKFENQVCYVEPQENQDNSQSQEIPNKDEQKTDVPQETEELSLKNKIVVSILGLILIGVCLVLMKYLLRKPKEEPVETEF